MFWTSQKCHLWPCLPISSPFDSYSTKITTIVEPLESHLWTNDDYTKVWDPLAIKGLWLFEQKCALINDILDNGDVHNDYKEAFIQGYQKAIRHGPLSDDPVFGCKCRVIEIESEYNPVQVIPTMLKSTHGAILSATPRYVEPMLKYSIVCPSACFVAVSKLASKRRGTVLHSKPIPATPLFDMCVLLPSMDSFGFEVDIRSVTQGAATVYSQMDHYKILESDPLLHLFQEVPLPILEPSPVQIVATDYLRKTRRRKGLGDMVLSDSLKALFQL